MAVINKFVAESTELKSIVFDPSESFDGSRKSLYAEGLETPSPKTLPMLAWSRSVMRRAEQGRVFNSKTKVSNSYSKIKAAVCEFDYKFNLYTTDIRKMEELELDFYTKVGFASLATITVVVPLVGEFQYSIQWPQSLDSAQINNEGDFYQMLSGTAIVKGTFMCVTPLTTEEMNSQILTITASLKGCNGEDLGTDNITTGD